MRKKFKLFVWDEFASDYYDGLAFAIAEDETEARKMIIKNRDGFNPDRWGEVQIFELNKPVAFYVNGGS